MNKLITLFLCLISISSFTQELNLELESTKLLNKGLKYSQLIKANEITLNKIDRENQFVYSYQNDNQITSIVFSKKPENNQIIRTYNYSDSLNVLQIDSVARNKSKEEELFVKMYYNMYASTMYFPHLPKYFWVIIEKKVDKFDCYMFPHQDDRNNIIFGNDYLFSYNAKGDFKDFKHLHNNPIPMSFDKPNDSEITLHTHANRNSKFISVLDIANLIVCKDKLEWKEHYVVSRKYVSIFNIDKFTLTIETKKDYERRTGIKL